MPTVSVGRDRLFAALGKTYTREEFEDLCFRFGIELDDVTTEKAIILKEKHLEEEQPSADDEVIYKIEVPANRNIWFIASNNFVLFFSNCCSHVYLISLNHRYDLLCLEGLAQALRIFNGQDEIPRYKVANISKESMLKMRIQKETSPIRPFVVCAVLRGITFDEASYNSFIDLQDKLHQNICSGEIGSATNDGITTKSVFVDLSQSGKRTLVAIGTHDLDTLQGPFTYEALPPPEINFVPLKQVKNFRADELMEFYKSDLKLKKFLHIIEKSNVFPVIYDHNRTVLSLPPIINGAHSAITLKTKNVFIECTATDLSKANIVLNTMITTFSAYCERKFEVEPVEVIDADGKSSIYPDLSEYKMEVPLSYITGTIGVPLEVDELESVYDKYDDEEEDSDLFGEDSDLFVCEGEQSDFSLDEVFHTCEGEDSEFVIDGKRLETVVSKQAVCDFVWMGIGWLFNHDMNQKKKPNKKYFYQKNTKHTLRNLVAKKIVKAGGFLGSNAKEKQNSVDPYIYRKYTRTRWNRWKKARGNKLLVTSLLNRMQLQANRGGLGDTINVSVPPTRSDILHACDVMEALFIYLFIYFFQDVAIAYGYNNIPKRKLSSLKPLPLNELSDLIRYEIAMNGFTEVLTWILCSKKEIFEMLNRKDDKSSAVIIGNPRSSDFEIFEVGDVVLLDEKKDVGASNQRLLAALYCGANSGFELIHSLVDRVMEVMGTPFVPVGDNTGYYIQLSDEPEFLTGRQAKIIYKGRRIGIFGIVHPENTKYMPKELSSEVFCTLLSF
ncbi:hypothetical protein COLO4_30269 [Corchorus olitorius]|uniref:phenylalanine--tRNA ligase n=1 Tax=Corchorus olitorius TaxID=93759 RepID=A0A1R3H9M5_9ROSI|nr:hypothetical protein COLO4_30269 [Corchorus olitorius]